MELLGDAEEERFNQELLESETKENRRTVILALATAGTL